MNSVLVFLAKKEICNKFSIFSDSGVLLPLNLSRYIIIPRKEKCDNQIYLKSKTITYTITESTYCTQNHDWNPLKIS